MSYCVLDPSEVRRLEDSGVIPCCKHHLHISNDSAERGLRDQALRHTGHRVRWLTATSQFVGWAGRPSRNVRVMQLVRHFSGRRIVAQSA